MRTDPGPVSERCDPGPIHSRIPRPHPLFPKLSLPILPFAEVRISDSQFYNFATAVPALPSPLVVLAPWHELLTSTFCNFVAASLSLPPSPRSLPLGAASDTSFFPRLRHCMCTTSTFRRWQPPRSMLRTSRCTCRRRWTVCLTTTYSCGASEVSETVLGRSGVFLSGGFANLGSLRYLRVAVLDRSGSPQSAIQT